MRRRNANITTCNREIYGLYASDVSACILLFAQEYQLKEDSNTKEQFFS